MRRDKSANKPPPLLHMTRYIESPLAQQDLIETIRTIAADNTSAAQSFLRDLEREYQLLAENPEMGRERQDLGRQLRSFSFRNSYLIIYRPINDGVAIAKFLHGARDLEALL